MRKIFSVAQATKGYSFGMLLLRFVVGIALMHHGWNKIQNPMGWMGEDSAIPSVLQALAAISEFFGGLFVAIGLLTPLASAGILCTMAYAVYKHAILNGDPFVGRPSYELALVYFIVIVLLIVSGPGYVCADYLLFGKRK